MNLFHIIRSNKEADKEIKNLRTRIESLEAALAYEQQQNIEIRKFLDTWQCKNVTELQDLFTERYRLCNDYKNTLIRIKQILTTGRIAQSLKPIK